MAGDTPTAYRNQVMYAVFVRNHSAEGTFEGVRKDLARIRALGVDVVWLLPIHPIGVVGRVGTLGSPYAIADYRGINPAYGTRTNFVALVDAIHDAGMRVIIDVVYNHTSPDSWLAAHRPEWFHRCADGTMGNKVGEWADVVDLDYGRAELWDYQIETLVEWARVVDGFRCDVAALVPLEFWVRARAAVAAVRPDCLWLAESVEAIFTAENRDRGMTSLSDGELYQAFDVTYEYDVFEWWRAYLEGRCTLAEYAGRVSAQDTAYPANYIKLRFLENHDTWRAAYLLPEPRARENWTAFSYFQKGMTLVYAGQERNARHLPSLFEPDPVDWTGEDSSDLYARLARVKKHPGLRDSRYDVAALPGEVLYARHRFGDRQLTGVFSVRGEAAVVPTGIPDGMYTNLIDDQPVEVRRGLLVTPGTPVIVESVREGSA